MELTQQYIDNLIGLLQESDTEKMIDEDLGLADSPLLALNEIMFSDELFKKLQEMGCQFDVLFDKKNKYMFELHIDEEDNENNKRLILDLCNTNGIHNKENILQFLNDDLANIQDITIKKAEKLLGLV